MVFPFPVFPGFLFVSLSLFLSGFPLVFPFPVFPWFPCRFYVVFPWFSLVLEPQENSGKTKRKLQENYRKTPTRNQARDQTRVSKEPAGLDFEPAGLDFEPAGLELKPVGLELEPAGLEFGPKLA